MLVLMMFSLGAFNQWPSQGDSLLPVFLQQILAPSLRLFLYGSAMPFDWDRCQVRSLKQ